MTTQNDDAVIEEFREIFSVPTKQDNWTSDTYPHPLGIINWLRTLLAKHRTELEEVRREEREHIRKLLNDYPTKCGINEIHFRLLKALTPTLPTDNEHE